MISADPLTLPNMDTLMKLPLFLLSLSALLLSSGCGGALDPRVDPVKQTTLRIETASPGEICPGERAQIQLTLEGAEGRSVSLSSEPESPLGWRDVSFEAVGGRVDEAVGVFEADEDVLRALREGYRVTAQLEARPEITAEASLSPDFRCLGARQVDVKAPLGLSLGYALYDETRYVIARLEREGTPPEYLAVDASSGRTLVLTLAGPGSDEELSRRVRVTLAIEHPELLDHLSLRRAMSGGDQQLLTPPKLRRRPIAEIFSAEHDAGLTLPTPPEAAPREGEVDEEKSLP